jgi:hypothetical protein
VPELGVSGLIYKPHATLVRRKGSGIGVVDVTVFDTPGHVVHHLDQRHECAHLPLTGIFDIFTFDLGDNASRSGHFAEIRRMERLRISDFWAYERYRCSSECENLIRCFISTPLENRERSRRDRLKDHAVD